jgi:hypothetical protein
MEYAWDFADPEDPAGQPVCASAPGVVLRVVDNQPDGGAKLNYGNYVVIDHEDGTAARYGHLLIGIPVWEGKRVTQGEVLGYVGKSGTAGGTYHLHFQVELTSNLWKSIPASFVECGVPAGGESYTSRNNCLWPGCPYPMGSPEQLPWGAACAGLAGPLVYCVEPYGMPCSAWGARQLTSNGVMYQQYPLSNGPVYGLWGALLQQHSAWACDLGWPKTCWEDAGRSCRGAACYHMVFERGEIIQIEDHAKGYWVPPCRISAIPGAMFDAWVATGGLACPNGLGAPLGGPVVPEDPGASQLHRLLGTLCQRYEGGYVTRFSLDQPYEAFPYVWYVDGDPALWWNDLGKRRVFRSWDGSQDWMAARDLPYDDAARLLPVVGTKVTCEQLEAILTGTAIPPLVGTIGSAAVWYIDQAKPTPRRHAVPNMTVFGNWGFEWWEVSWLRADHPHRSVNRYPEAAPLAGLPPKVTITSLPSKAWLGPPIVVKWNTEGFPGDQVSDTSVTWRVNCNPPMTTAGVSLGNGEYKAEIPTSGVVPALTKGDTVWVHVYAEGDGLPADDPDGSEGNWWRGVTIGTDSIPTLRWAGGAGYTSDGVNPDQGIANQTRFVWKVKYADADGDAPLYVKAEIRRNGKALPALALTGKAGTFTTGRVYAGGRRLNLGTYEYRFAAEDDDGVAAGAPTAWKPGPVVTSAAPAQVAEASLGLAGVSAAPVRAGGAQISFALTTKASVEVEVLNVAGRAVREVWRDRECTKGRNAVLWDGRSDAGTTAPPGIYLVKLRAYTQGGQQVQSLTSVRVVR